MEERTRKSDIHHCARCGKDHDGMEFKRFNGEPIEDCDGTIWDWWGVCPVTGDPVLQRTLEKPELIRD
jgi:hypothetical protein